MNEQPSLSELRFHPDFAMRVLDEADTIVRRRHNWRMAGVATAAVVAAFGLWTLQPSSGPAPDRASLHTPVTRTDELASARIEGQSDPLQWMFPDARPVAQFADTYSDAMTGDVARRQRQLFAEDIDQEESL